MKLTKQIRAHLQQLPSHVKNRDSAILLYAALARIEKMEHALRNVHAINPKYGLIVSGDKLTDLMIKSADLHQLQQFLKDD